MNLAALYYVCSVGNPSTCRKSLTNLIT